MRCTCAVHVLYCLMCKYSVIQLLYFRQLMILGSPGNISGPIKSMLVTSQKRHLVAGCYEDIFVWDLPSQFGAQRKNARCSASTQLQISGHKEKTVSCLVQLSDDLIGK